MAHIDRHVGRPHNPNRLPILTKLAIIGLLAWGLVGCGTTSAQAPLPTDLPPSSAPLSDILVVPQVTAEAIASPTPNIVSPTPPIEALSPTPTIQIEQGQPYEWPLGVNAITSNGERMINELNTHPDQTALAEQLFSKDFLRSVVQIKFKHMVDGAEKSYGSTGFVYAQDNAYSYIFTDLHAVTPSNPTSLAIISPFTGTNQTIDLNSLTLFQPKNGEVNEQQDIVIAKVPLLPRQAPYAAINTTYCSSHQPIPGEITTTVGFPYLIDHYTTFASEGTIENVSSTCWSGYSDVSQSPLLMVPTTISILPGGSGEPILNAQGEVIGLAEAAGPNGLQFMPIKASTLLDLQQQIGLTP